MTAQKQIALISPRDGVAGLLSDDEQFVTLAAPAAQKGRVIAAGNYATRFPDTTVVEVANPEDAVKCLAEYQTQSLALDFTLLLFDREISQSTRVDIARQLDTMLANQKRREYLLDIILASPLPADADSDGALVAANSQNRVRSLVETILECQSRVRIAFSAWLTMRTDSMVQQAGINHVHGALIDSGVFRRLVEEGKTQADFESMKAGIVKDERLLNRCNPNIVLRLVAEYVSAFWSTPVSFFDTSLISKPRGSFDHESEPQSPSKKFKRTRAKGKGQVDKNADRESAGYRRTHPSLNQNELAMQSENEETREQSLAMSTMTASAKKRKRAKKGNPFHQRLASLTFYQACQMLGDAGPELMGQGDREFEIDFDRDIFLGGDLFRVRLQDANVSGGLAIATFTLQSARANQLQANCDRCQGPCPHQAAALSYLLDAKSVLGLAAAPDESVPVEHLTLEELHQRALAERHKQAAEERMTVRSSDTSRPWTDYIVTSEDSGKTYRVALRGREPGQSYCSCSDFRTNRLGTCKHILNVQAKIEKRFSAAQLRAPYQRKNISLRLHYADPLGVGFNLPYKPDTKVEKIVGPDTKPITDAAEVMQRIASLEHAGYDVHIYPDAEDFLQTQLTQKQLQEECESIRKDVNNHPLRRELLNGNLLPYQLDGIAFAVGAGRAILADDMGLGKMIQGIGVAELLARFVDIRRVLIICPASLKSQWHSEIQRFSGRSVQLVLGNGAERYEQYRSNTFFTICNYEQVLRDVTAIESVSWDLIILDEGQLIKNWESKTSNTIRSLQSTYRLVLTGTPLENRLGDLFTIARFVDEQRLGPAYQFFNRHHVVDESGKTIGYQRLDELQDALQPILLRRKRDEVAKELPERTDEIVRIEPTAEQKEIHDAQMAVVARIIAKRFLTEMDLLRLRQCLAAARMACDSTFLVDKEEPEYSSKLERIGELLDGLIDDPTRKIVLFSEWRTMLDRIERRLDVIGCDYVRLDGQVPQKKRPEIVAKFQNDPECRVILMTNAGSTGLNLQSGNTVINVDLPWNPAVLEQRIARAHRMGQKNPVHVYKLVTTDTIEEKLLETLASKQELANASIDMNSDVESVTMIGGMEDLRRRLEQILGPRIPAPVDESQQRRVIEETQVIAARREKGVGATDQLIGIALSRAGKLTQLKDAGDATPAIETVEKLTERLSECIDTDSEGHIQLTIRLPGKDALRGLAITLAKLLD